MKKNSATFMISGIALLTIAFGCSESSKEPSWQKAQTLADKLDHPAAITTDGEFIYYVTGGTVASLNEGTSGVWKMPLAGGEPKQLFKGRKNGDSSSILPGAWVLQLDEKYLYWSSGSIWRTPKDGGASERIMTGNPTEMIMDDTTIYWHNYVGEGMQPVPIHSAPKAGGEARAITEPLIISGLAVDKDLIYWAQLEGIFRMSKTGGTPEKFYAPPDGQRVSGLIADADFLYFTQGTGRNALMKLAKTGGKTLQLAPRINTAHKFHADDTHIYFIIDYQTFSSALNKVSKAGGDVTQLDSGYLKSFAVGNDKIFVTDVSKIYVLRK